MTTIKWNCAVRSLFLSTCKYDDMWNQQFIYDTQNGIFIMSLFLLVCNVYMWRVFCRCKQHQHKKTLCEMTEFSLCNMCSGCKTEWNSMETKYVINKISIYSVSVAATAHTHFVSGNNKCTQLYNFVDIFHVWTIHMHMTKSGFCSAICSTNKTELQKHKANEHYVVIPSGMKYCVFVW